MAASQAPPPPENLWAHTSVQMVEAVKWQTAATLASAIISASGRPYSINEALEILQDVRFALYPEHNSSAYKEWEKSKDVRLKKVYI